MLLAQFWICFEYNRRNYSAISRKLFKKHQYRCDSGSSGTVKHENPFKKSVVVWEDTVSPLQRYAHHRCDTVIFQNHQKGARSSEHWVTIFFSLFVRGGESLKSETETSWILITYQHFRRFSLLETSHVFKGVQRIRNVSTGSWAKLPSSIFSACFMEIKNVCVRPGKIFFLLRKMPRKGVAN